jgi:hypothetical protein
MPAENVDPTFVAPVFNKKARPLRSLMGLLEEKRDSYCASRLRFQLAFDFVKLCDESSVWQYLSFTSGQPVVSTRPECLSSGVKEKYMLPRSLLLSMLTLLPSVANAFCGFYVGGASTKMYNNATQVVLLRDGTRTVLSMQNNYQGPTDKFAMVIPVPVILQKENVKTLLKEVFARVDTLDAPRLVEYWEQDPCYQPPPRDDRKFEMVPMPTAMAEPEKSAKDFGVKIEAQFSVAEYDIVILSAQNSTGLDGWLKQEKYNIPEGAGPVLAPYVAGGMKFFVAKVDPTKVTFNADGQAMLSPLRFHYDAETFALPIRLGMLNAKDKQDLIVHILAKDRYEVTNYTNVFIPTNLEVAESVKDNFASFYATLFDATMEKFKDADGRNPVITEYSWMAGSCDPCPGPSLQAEDVLTLGGDVLPSFTADIQSGHTWVLTNLTLTRLHARYDQKTLGEDLIFKSGIPKEGGRETGYGTEKNYNDARDSYENNFQGRYIIRHPWEGQITCQNPRRGIWGGPPNGGGFQPTAARDLAFAQRGTVMLKDAVLQDVPALGFKAAPKKIAADDKKIFKAPTVASNTKPSHQPAVTPFGTPFNWALVIAGIGGVLLLLLLWTSRPKKH